MTVLRPSLLWTVPLLPLLLVLALGVRARRARRVRGYLEGHPGAEFWPVAPTPLSFGEWWRVRGLFLILSGVFLGLAMAGPTLGTRQEITPVPTRPLVLVLDLSSSMAVADVPLGRLGAARMVARRVVGAAPALPVGLVVFAGEPHVVLPPTADREILLGYLDAAGPEMLTRQGTELTGALEEAAGMGGDGGVHVLVLSDGELHDGGGGSLQAARVIREKGGWVSAVSLGTEEGGPVPMGPAQTESLRIESPSAEAEGGNPLSRARPALLRALAEAGGGVFAEGRATAEVSEVVAWVGERGREGALGLALKEVPRDLWVWFLALAVGGLMMEAALDGTTSRKEAVSWP